MRQVDTIDVIGVNGDFCRISPPGCSWGPELAPGSTGLFDMPIKTSYGVGPFGSFFSSWKPQMRTVVWTIHVMNPNTGGVISEDSALWRDIYSRWRNMFAPDKEATVVYESVTGVRTLGLKTLQTSKSFSAQSFEGKDPSIFTYGSIVQTTAAELPFYVGAPDKFAWETAGPGSFWFPLPYYNPATIDIWPEWFCTGGAAYTFPDYSFGNESYGRGLADIGKTIPLSPLLANEDLDIQTRPDLETFITSIETPFGNRNPGRDFEYPIPPGKGSSGGADSDTPGCVVLANVTNPSGARVELTLPRWYDTPFSTPRVV